MVLRSADPSSVIGRNPVQLESPPHLHHRRRRCRRRPHPHRQMFQGRYLRHHMDHLL